MEKLQDDLASHYSVYLNTPENKDVIWVIWKELWRGVQWIVYNIWRSDSVLKLYFDTPENLQATRTEACRQEDFCDVIWYGYKVWLPRNFFVPELLHIIHNNKREIIGIVMKKIEGKSLNTIEAWNIAIQDWVITRKEFDDLSEWEFIERFWDLRQWYKYYPDDFDVSNFSQELIDQVKRMYEFFEKCWLEHGDLHSWNIMLWKLWELYFLDFWKSLIIPKKATVYKHALLEWKNFRLETYLQKDIIPAGIFHAESDVEKLTYPFHDQISVREECFDIYHNDVPRGIASYCMAIAYSKSKALDPKVDNYYYQNHVGYDIGWWYFLVCEEGRYDWVENEFSKEVLNQVIQAHSLRWYIKDAKGRLYYIYSINQDTSNIISQVTAGITHKIITKNPPLS